MLPTLIAYARGAGIDARWLVIEGAPDFFRLTKRLHHALHGSSGDGSPLGDAERDLYEQVLRANAKELEGIIRPRDVVVLHDPQTAGLAPHLIRLGAVVIWRCHIGCDRPDEQAELGWSFLRPYLAEVAALVFSREAYIPSWCERAPGVVIQPSIDPFSAKNQDLDEDTVRAILVHTGLVEGPSGDGAADIPPGGRDARAGRPAGRHHPPGAGSRLGRSAGRADLALGSAERPPGCDAGFADLVDGTAPAGAELVWPVQTSTRWPTIPRARQCSTRYSTAWRQLSHADRRRIQLVNLPMADAEENAAIVNALQRHAAVVVQKSLHEGFGLTVTEAMWKGRPIVASATGGIQDQIVDGIHGLLVPTRTISGLRRGDPATAGGPALRRATGCNARERARQEYLGVRHLLQYEQLLATSRTGPRQFSTDGSLDLRGAGTVEASDTADDAEASSRASVGP